MGKSGARNAEQMLREALRLEQVGRLSEGLALAREIVKAKPGWAYGHYAVGSILCAQGFIHESDTALRKAIARDQGLGGVYSRHAEVLNRLGRFDEAVEAASKAVELAPEQPKIRVVKAMVLWLGGHPEEAYRFLGDSIAEGSDPGSADANLRSIHGAIAGQIGRLDEGIATLEAIVQEADAKRWTDPFLHAATLMHLSKLYDKAGRYEEAFGAAHRSGAMRKTGYDPSASEALCSERIGVWSKEAIAGLPRSRVESEKPVFILGMPRSGTSLVEQIVASHPLAFGGGEQIETYNTARALEAPTAVQPDRMDVVRQLKRATLDRCARKILKEMERAAGAESERITDKLPNNYEHVGMIGLLFPNAKIIHCKRDPLDTCVSCFLLDFVGDTNHGYSYNLAHLAHHYKLYQRYMEHWRAVSPIEMLEVSYEELVANPVDGARRIIEYVGLDWDDRCARSHETKRSVSTLSSDQVRKPMYTSSVERWRNYERWIGELVEGLGIRD
jgi:tetratricopeptide (TPR) repeat protein